MGSDLARKRRGEKTRLPTQYPKCVGCSCISTSMETDIDSVQVLTYPDAAGDGADEVANDNNDGNR